MNPIAFPFARIISEAVRDISQHGFDNAERIAQWAETIRQAAEAALMSPEELERLLRSQLTSVYDRLVIREGLLRTHDIPRFTLINLQPKLHGELQKRLMASADLIKLNRRQMVDRTVQRFIGWASSVPAGGSKAVDRAAESTHIRKALSTLPFEQRRVMIDQGHKLTAAINEVVSTDAGAIAGEWHSHYRQPGYNYREDHKDRDGQVYALRGNWAISRGLMKVGQAGYYDAITKVGEEPFCRCFMRFIYALRRLPDDMITAKGSTMLNESKAKASA